MDRTEYLIEKLRKAIAAKIRREGWSQSEAGKLCGTSRINMNHLINGTGKVGLQKLIEVAEGIGLRVELLVEEKPGRTK